MAYKADVKIDLSPLQHFSNALEEKRRAGLKKAIEEIYKVSQELVPEATGALKRSGTVDTSNPDEVSLTYGESTEFNDQRATAVEFGTRNMAAQPYVTPALERTNITEIIAAEIFK